MFGFNEDSATLINEVFEDKKTKYYVTHLTDIDWQQQSIGLKYLKSLGAKTVDENKVLIFVNYGIYDRKEYIGPKAFKRIEDKENYFTFEEGKSILIKGIHDIKINTVQEFKELQDKFDDYVKVTSITKCDLTKHFELGCE